MIYKFYMSLFEYPGWLAEGSVFQQIPGLPLLKLLGADFFYLPEVCTLAVTSLHRRTPGVFNVQRVVNVVAIIPVM